MFERPKSGELAILVHVIFSDEAYQEDLQEFQELVVSAGAKPVATITTRKKTPEAKYFVGSGKAEEIRASVIANQAELVIFNHALTPAQERNLETFLKCRVIDRTGLILDIFAQRARTFEGKLQVELAQLQHLATRLVRGWTHLERQKGGIGLRGPGETQLETDRRLVRARIKTIEKRLIKVRQQREQGRRARQRSETATISLVGYTNAGKSTLFNQLTGAAVYVADQLFATLDPTLRKIDVPGLGSIILADTVGFIRHLPHDLVQAFRATLEESRDADLLLHVIDASSETRHDNIEQVDQVLAQIDAQDIPQIQIYNKIDRLAEYAPRIERDDEGKVKRIWLSALTGEGVELLQTALLELLTDEIIECGIQLSVYEESLRAALHRINAVVQEEVLDIGGSRLIIRLSQQNYSKYIAPVVYKSQQAHITCE